MGFLNRRWSNGVDNRRLALQKGGKDFLGEEFFCTHLPTDLSQPDLVEPIAIIYALFFWQTSWMYEASTAEVFRQRNERHLISSGLSTLDVTSWEELVLLFLFTIVHLELCLLRWTCSIGAAMSLHMIELNKCDRESLDENIAPISGQGLRENWRTMAS